jgi:hypothetical protein
MKNWWVIIILSLLVLLGYGWARFKQAEITPDLSQSELLGKVVDCDLSQQGCTLEGYQLEFERPVKPLTLLKARLLSEHPIDSAVLYLEMKDMDMGINRFTFRQVGQGAWEADMIIPVCATGRRDWFASLVILADGKHQRLVFPFTVKGK